MSLEQELADVKSRLAALEAILFPVPDYQAAVREAARGNMKLLERFIAAGGEIPMDQSSEAGGGLRDA